MSDHDAPEDPARAMGRRIQRARKAAGYRTAQDLADDLGISVWTVHSWESGKSQPRYDMLATLARLTDHPMAHFLGESPPHLDLPADEDLEAGVYGLAPYNQAATDALNDLTDRARDWGLLLRLSTPLVVTADQLAALSAALSALRPT